MKVQVGSYVYLGPGNEVKDSCYNTISKPLKFMNNHDTICKFKCNKCCLFKISIKHGSKTFQDLYDDTLTFFLCCQCFTKLLLTTFLLKELRVRTHSTPIILFSSTLFITDLHCHSFDDAANFETHH